MRPKPLVIVAAIVIAGILSISGTGTFHLIGFYREHLSAPMFALWLSGWLGFTLLPVCVALLLWRAARRIGRGWLLHVFALPAIWVTGNGFGSLMLYAADEPDMDGPTGWATLPAMLLMLVVIVAYLIALIRLRYRRVALT